MEKHVWQRGDRTDTPSKPQISDDQLIQDDGILDNMQLRLIIVCQQAYLGTLQCFSCNAPMHTAAIRTICLALCQLHGHENIQERECGPLSTFHLAATSVHRHRMRGTRSTQLKSMLVQSYRTHVKLQAHFCSHKRSIAGGYHPMQTSEPESLPMSRRNCCFQTQRLSLPLPLHG